MSSLIAITSLTLLFAPVGIARVALVPDNAPQSVFAGDAPIIRITFHNPDAQLAEIKVRTLLHQASNSTAIALGVPVAWKKLRILPGQTILETAALPLPAVTAETRFIVQWLDEQNQVLGRTDLLVFPGDLLQRLQPLIGANPLGVFDPQNQLRPLLQQAGIKFTDLADGGLATFSGQLIILGPFLARSQLRAAFASRMLAAAKNGAAIVWLQPPPGPGDRLTPSFYLVPEGRGAIVVARHDLVDGLADNPQAQLNLVYFSRLALNPQPPALPALAAEP